MGAFGLVVYIDDDDDGGGVEVHILFVIFMPCVEYVIVHALP